MKLVKGEKHGGTMGGRGKETEKYCIRIKRREGVVEEDIVGEMMELAAESKDREG